MCDFSLENPTAEHLKSMKLIGLQRNCNSTAGFRFNLESEEFRSCACKSLEAISALVPRFSRQISFMVLGRTEVRSASFRWLNPRSSNSSRRTAPGELNTRAEVQLEIKA